MTKNYFFIITCLSAVSVLAKSDAPTVSPDEALGRLRAGNVRFVEANTSSAKPTRAARLATAQEQHPFAIVVGCADSRTSPEIVFDQNIGDLFVVRTAGNLVDDHALGSIEYAVEHLGARLIVVLGHARCGAVEAALGVGEMPGHIASLVRDIRPAIQLSKNGDAAALTDAIKANVTAVAEKIRKDAQLGSNEVRIVGAYYDFDTGKVELLQP